MAFVDFMRSWAGRMLRVIAGVALVWFGLTQSGGVGGLLLAAFGTVATAAGLVNVCLIGPLFGSHADGKAAGGTVIEGT